jgi:2-polyprenyl-3-methyl-5-hydroxy-6-metoxy-1,4-benzoquinol methylase
MRILVAIASYGDKNDRYLERLIEEYRRMPWHVDIVVLSNRHKEVPGGATLLVGMPDPANHWSLPFLHRRLFVERREQYDLFIYSEDDTLVRTQNVDTFIRTSKLLRSDEIPGFMRSEEGPDGRLYVSTVHAYFRWITSGVVHRGDELFAPFSNEHAACYMATRQQLDAAIESGGFMVPPHEGRYDMLCAAATDIYAQCGFKRLVCLTNLHDVLLPHLPNKYVGKLGVPFEEVQEQLTALRCLASRQAWLGPLFPVETPLLHGHASKNLYEAPDAQLLELIPSSAVRVLSVGCGWGATEAAIASTGKEVVGIPIDPVFGHAIRRRGIESIDGPWADAVATLEGHTFDVALVSDVLHLVEDPASWLSDVRTVLASHGTVIVSVPQINDILTRVRNKATGSRPEPMKPIGLRRVKQWLRDSGLNPTKVVSLLDGRRQHLARRSLGLLNNVVADRFHVVAQPRVDSRASAL